FERMLERVDEGGIFLITRWLQVPPSESIRTIAAIVTALERGFSVQPGDTLIAFRGIQTMTIMVKPEGWDESEVKRIREFTAQNRFDLVWTPGILAEETNRFNILPESSYYQLVRDLLGAEDRITFYKDYPFEITPPTDNQPFFFHFFKWEQTQELLAVLGMMWQPFGGSGYFVLIALLGLVIVFSVVLIFVPVVYMDLLKRRSNIKNIREIEPGFPQAKRWQILVYFGMLGLGFLFVEIPIIQRSILLLGHPIFAFSIVILALLTFSGLGSALARVSWLPRRWIFFALVIMALITPFLFNLLNIAALGLPFVVRVIMVVLTLAPLSVLMGLPFPLGLAWLERMRGKANYDNLIPWAWAINGCASVISAVLAALFALSFGFMTVLLIGAAAYGTAGILYASLRW
ncbi:MAG: hypothetical protein ACNA8H_13325, partial [Anaerolineales bacterium]